MEDLKALFKVRDEHHFKHTQKIFEQINTTLGCITAYLINLDEGIAQGIITWEETSFMEDMIIILGTVDYQVGETIELIGVQFNITEENVDEFQRMVHISVPFELVQEDDENKIMEYLYNTGENKSPEEFSEVIMPKPALDAEFDLSDLTEDQREQLRLSTIKGGH